MSFRSARLLSTKQILTLFQPAYNLNPQLPLAQIGGLRMALRVYRTSHRFIRLLESALLPQASGQLICCFNCRIPITITEQRCLRRPRRCVCVSMAALACSPEATGKHTPQQQQRGRLHCLPVDQQASRLLSPLALFPPLHRPHPSRHPAWRLFPP